jgi:LPXTG-motif cell wall-anchored protein
VPGDIFDLIKGQEVSLVFDMGNGIKWTVDGKTVVGDNNSDIDLGVSTGSAANPISEDVLADVINNVTGEKYTLNLTLAHNGEFGFTAVMSIGLEEKNAGYYANLFYYNRSAGKLEFMCADQIAKDGTAKLAFTHASDYVIVIDAVSLEPGLADDKASLEPGVADAVTAAPAAVVNPTAVVSPAEASSENNITETGDGTLMTLAFAGLAVSAGLLFVLIRRKRQK